MTHLPASIDLSASTLNHESVACLLLDLTRLIERYLTAAEVEKVERAFMFAAHAHRHCKRKSGEPYIIHPMHVTCTLADLHMDVDTLCAGLLHDVVEDTDSTLGELEEHFGATVAKLVDGVTKLSTKEFRNKEQATLHSFKKMMQYMVDDFRVVLVKLADRLHNVSTLDSMPVAKQRRIATETLEIHVQLARRMGMNNLRLKLQEQAFKYHTHRRFEVIERWWVKYQQETEAVRYAILNQIRDTLLAANLKATVFEWDKNLYKVYILEKHRRGKKDFNRKELPLDIRIIVNHDKDCYAVLGIIHQLYRPKSKAFRDYIAVPKSYGFQALQTTLLTPSQRVVKVQIQSREMYQVAQYGITSQWRYPHLNKRTNVQISQQHLNYWLSEVNEIYQTAGKADDFMADVKAGLSYDEVTVFTPSGNIKVLPPGATAIDFAYAMSMETGQHCVSAVIDGDQMPLSTQLIEGATIDIITQETATPHPSWLNVVRTGKARAAIRYWLDSQHDESIAHLGEMLLRNALANFGISLGEIDEKNVALTLDKLKLPDLNDLFLAIGRGDHCSKLAARRLFNNTGLSLKPEHAKNEPLFIKSTEGLAVSFKSCCSPIPGDIITAKLNYDSGLEVHRAECLAVRNQHSSETISLSWENDIHHTFNACILIIVRNKVGMLRTITEQVESFGVSIEDLNITGDADIKEDRLLIKVKDLKHLNNIINSLKHEKDILEVQRILTIEPT